MARRRRQRHHEEAEQHERWMVSYADFITLLFAFFVVMYSMSSVNEGKYRVLSTAIEAAFAPVADKNAIPSGSSSVIGLDTLASVTIQPIKLDMPVVPKDASAALSEEIIKERQLLNNVSIQFQAALKPFMDQNQVAVKQHDFWVELEMNSELLFLSGESEVSNEAYPMLKKVAEVVSGFPNMINVEGYSDNVPINTVKFPSNWDLSSARATSVVRELIKDKISPERLAAVGYGEFHQIADNATEAGRFKNRRVVLLVMSQAFSRYGMDDKERALRINSGVTAPFAAPNTASIPSLK